MANHLNLECLFADKSVTYEQFIDELASRLVLKMRQVDEGFMEISKNKAYKMFGRCDVDRWIKNGKLEPSRISPGIIRFRLADLIQLAEIKQNNKL